MQKTPHLRAISGIGRSPERHRCIFVVPRRDCLSPPCVAISMQPYLYLLLSEMQNSGRARLYAVTVPEPSAAALVAPRSGVSQARTQRPCEEGQRVARGLGGLPNLASSDPKLWVSHLPQAPGEDLQNDVPAFPFGRTLRKGREIRRTKEQGTQNPRTRILARRRKSIPPVRPSKGEKQPEVLMAQGPTLARAARLAPASCSCSRRAKLRRSAQPS